MVTRLLAGAVLTGVQIGLADPAAAIPGLHTVTAGSELTGLQDFKAARAKCPFGENVIGGGGEIIVDNAADRNKVVLTGLRPIDELRDLYVVEAAELTITGGTVGSWRVEAYALCAPAPPGWQIVPASTNASSNPVQATFAACPSHQRVIGTGAKISPFNDEVYLQVARASGPGDIARAQGHEDVNGFSGNWSVTAYAVCIDTPPGYKVVFGPSPQAASETTKTAFADCPNGTRVHGGGIAVTNTAPSGVALQSVVPFTTPERVRAIAMEATFTNANWDNIVAAAICAF